MALVPCSSSLWHDWWHDFERPLCFLDDHFHHLHDDFCHPLTWPIFGSYLRPWHRLIERRVTRSETTTTPCPVAPNGKFSVVIDVPHFAPHEILVKTSGNTIIIEAKHEERNCCGRQCTTEIMRRYDLPKGYDINQVMASLSSTGVLTVTAPKTPLSPPAPRERIVPIDRTCC